MLCMFIISFDKYLISGNSKVLVVLLPLTPFFAVETWLLHLTSITASVPTLHSNRPEV